MPDVELLPEGGPGRSASRRARARHPLDAAAAAAGDDARAAWLADRPRRPAHRGHVSASVRLARRHLGAITALGVLAAVFGGSAWVAQAQSRERVTFAAQRAVLQGAVVEATRLREAAERQSAQAEAERVRTEREREIAVTDALAGQIDAERARTHAQIALTAERNGRYLAERRLGEASRALDAARTPSNRPVALPDADVAQEPRYVE